MVAELKQQRAKILEEAKAILDKAEKENRDLTREEREAFEALMAKAKELRERIERLEKVEAALAETRQVNQQELRTEPEDEPAGLIGMSQKELREYSLLRAIRAAVNRDWSKAGLEAEASRAVAEKLGREPRGFFVPYDVLVGAEARGIIKGTATQGGYLVGQEPITFIEMLRAKLVLRRAGARMLTGLRGDLPLTRLLGGATAQWVAENAEATESNYNFDQVVLSPKTVSATTSISRKMLNQASEDVEALVREDIATVIALAIDRAALHGSGVAPEPRGLAVHPQVNVVAIGPDGGPPTWQHIVEMETAIAQANADVDRMAYITNPKVRGYLKTTPKVSGQAVFIWGEDNTVNGYRGLVTTQVRSDLTKGVGTNLSAIFFGNWADLIIAVWGNGLDILVDPYSQGRSGQLLVTGFMDVDVEPRHGESFSVILDAQV